MDWLNPQALLLARRLFDDAAAKVSSCFSCFSQVFESDRQLAINVESRNVNASVLHPMSHVEIALCLELVSLSHQSHFLAHIHIACTFLGPSRKRGPPKGYIDAIEARLHQAEALLGIMLASGDPRAETLLQDISQVKLSLHLPFLGY